MSLTLFMALYMILAVLICVSIFNEIEVKQCSGLNICLLVNQDVLNESELVVDFFEKNKKEIIKKYEENTNSKFKTEIREMLALTETFINDTFHIKNFQFAQSHKLKIKKDNMNVESEEIYEDTVNLILDNETWTKEILILIVKKHRLQVLSKDRYMSKILLADNYGRIENANINLYFYSNKDIKNLRLKDFNIKKLYIVFFSNPVKYMLKNSIIKNNKIDKIDFFDSFNEYIKQLKDYPHKKNDKLIIRPLRRIEITENIDMESIERLIHEELDTKYGYDAVEMIIEMQNKFLDTINDDFHAYYDFCHKRNLRLISDSINIDKLFDSLLKESSNFQNHNKNEIETIEEEIKRYKDQLKNNPAISDTKDHNSLLTTIKPPVETQKPVFEGYKCDDYGYVVYFLEEVSRWSFF